MVRKIRQILISVRIFFKINLGHANIKAATWHPKLNLSYAASQILLRKGKEDNKSLKNKKVHEKNQPNLKFGDLDISLLKSSLTKSGIVSHHVEPWDVTPKFASLSAHWFPSRKTWDILKDMEWVAKQQLNHWDLCHQVSKSWDVQARTTKVESHSSHKWSQPRFLAILIASIVAWSSAQKVVVTPKWVEKQPKKLPPRVSKNTSTRRNTINIAFGPPPQ